MNVKDLIELLRALPKCSKIALQQKNLRRYFVIRIQDGGRGRLRGCGCDLTVDEGVAIYKGQLG